jgi:ATP-binding cassette subfamily B protein
MNCLLRSTSAPISRHTRRRVPYVPQMEFADCGAACLAMVLRYFGKPLSLATVRDAIGPGRDGIKASTIAKSARSFGLDAWGVKLNALSVRSLSGPAILFWKSNHFVVYERHSRRGVVIVDPAIGRRVVDEAEFSDSFSNVAILLVPSSDFDRHVQSEPRDRRMLDALTSQKRRLFGVLVLSLVLQGMALSIPIASGFLIDGLAGANDPGPFPLILGGLAAIAIGYFFASLIRSRTLLSVRRILDIRMTGDFVRHLTALPYGFFMTRSQGDLMMRVNSNATVRELTTAGAVSTLLDGSLALFYVIIILWKSLPLGLLVAGLAGLQTLVLLATRRPLRNLMTENLRAQAKSQSQLAQMIAGIETIKAAGVEDLVVQKWKGFFADEVDASVRRGHITALAEAALTSLRNVSPLIILALGVFLVGRGQLTLGTMLALVAMATGLLDPVGRLVVTFSQFQLLGSYLDRMKDVWATPPEQTSGPPAAPRLEGAITLRNVSFKHGPFAPNIVEQVSLSIRTGRSVALVGPSGCGKSTLVRILVGLCPPTTGHVLFDAYQLEELDLRSLRKQIGIVPQHPYIFSASVRDNIALSSPEASMEEIVRAASLACLHEDIRKMPMGYETILGDGGSLISGGQRQRIALARALLRRPAILVLDEATSALDSVTESRVMQHLNSIPTTKIIVAHRLSTIAMADEIVVMTGGRVAESGSHSSLMRRKGLYAALVKGQEPHTESSPSESGEMGRLDFAAASGVDAGLGPGDPIRGIGEGFV